MTGANRLLVGLAWPLIVLLHWMKDGHRAIDLAPANATEFGFLFLASIYAFAIVFRGRITLFDFAILVVILPMSGAFVICPKPTIRMRKSCRGPPQL